MFYYFNLIKKHQLNMYVCFVKIIVLFFLVECLFIFQITINQF